MHLHFLQSLNPEADLPPEATRTFSPYFASSAYIYDSLREHTHLSQNTNVHTKRHTHSESLLPFCAVSLHPENNGACFGNEPVPLISIRSRRGSCSGDGYFSDPSSTFPGGNKRAWSTAVSWSECRWMQVLKCLKYGIIQTDVQTVHKSVCVKISQL